jgi:hypothetical protein
MSGSQVRTVDALTGEGSEWSLRIRDACSALDRTAKAAPPSTGIRPLADIRDVWPFDAANSFIRTEDLFERLHDVPDGPWDTVEQTGVPALTARRLAHLLKPYRITSGKNADLTLRGYHRYQFADAWRRYLPSTDKGL